MMCVVEKARVFDALRSQQRAVSRLRLRAIDHFEMLIRHARRFVNDHQLPVAVFTSNADRLALLHGNLRNEPLITVSLHFHTRLFDLKVVK